MPAHVRGKDDAEFRLVDLLAVVFIVGIQPLQLAEPKCTVHSRVHACTHSRRVSDYKSTRDVYGVNSLTDGRGGGGYDIYINDPPSISASSASSSSIHVYLQHGVANTKISAVCVSALQNWLPPLSWCSGKERGREEVRVIWICSVRWVLCCA